MAKFKGDYYIIDRDEREIGGECDTIATFKTWREAKKAWDEMKPDPASDVTLWFARKNDTKEGRCETITSKPEDHHPFFNLVGIFKDLGFKAVPVEGKKGVKRIVKKKGAKLNKKMQMMIDEMEAQRKKRIN